MKTAAVLIALAVTLALQTTLSGVMIGRTVPVNLVLVAIVYLSLAYGPVTGMLAGTAGGLVQDALAGGIVGAGGLTKTLIGFLVGVLGAQFIVSNTLPRLLMFISATLVHELLFEGLQALVAGRGFSPQYSAWLMQSLVNGAIGVTAFLLVERGPEAVQRRRLRRASFSKRRF